eukprot:6791524-Pyramimonas_sp.AAC.1
MMTMTMTMTMMMMMMMMMIMMMMLLMLMMMRAPRRPIRDLALPRGLPAVQLSPRKSWEAQRSAVPRTPGLYHAPSGSANCAG